MGTKREGDSCYEAADPDEPMFVLLARDINAPGLVRTWCSVRIAQIANGEKPLEDIGKVREAQILADRMEAWRRKGWPRASERVD